MKMLASCGEKRSAVAPEIPTTTELGIPDSTVTTVNMVACPSGTPQPIVAALVAATRKVMREEGTLASLSQLGIEPVSDADPVRSSKFFAAEISRWGPIVKASGATI
jgi:tripartite-type tricarboxylate transporter receptor subunit TctC